MRSLPALFAALLALSFVDASPANANVDSDRGRPSRPKPPKPPKTRGAPAPVVGVGLPILLLAGGAYWLIRRREDRSIEQGQE